MARRRESDMGDAGCEMQDAYCVVRDADCASVSVRVSASESADGPVALHLSGGRDH